MSQIVVVHRVNPINNNNNNNDEEKKDGDHLKRLGHIIIESKNLKFKGVCSVCFEEVLYCITPCAHRLCMGCAMIISGITHQGGAIIRCPECRHEFNYRSWYQNIVLGFGHINVANADRRIFLLRNASCQMKVEFQRF